MTKNFSVFPSSSGNRKLSPELLLLFLLKQDFLTIARKIAHSDMQNRQWPLLQVP